MNVPLPAGRRGRDCLRFTVSWARHMNGGAHLLSSRRLTFPESHMITAGWTERVFQSHLAGVRFRSRDLPHRSIVLSSLGHDASLLETCTTLLSLIMLSLLISFTGAENGLLWIPVKQNFNSRRLVIWIILLFSRSVGCWFRHRWVIYYVFNKVQT